MTPQPAPVKIMQLDYREAEELFLYHFHNLTNGAFQ